MGAIAFYPVNYTIEPTPTTATPSRELILAQAGGYMPQYGGPNKGPVVRWPKSNIYFSVGEAVGAPRDAGRILFYPVQAGDDISVTVRVRVRFFRRALFDPLAQARLGFTSVEHKDILLSGDVERNPGPEDGADEGEADDESDDDDAA